MYDSGNQLDTIPDMIIHSEGLTYDDGFGIPVVIGDVNGDGWNDIVAAALSFHEFGSMDDDGKLYVFYGGIDIDTIPDFTVTAAYNNFGHELGIGLDCGDVNGDGYADILAMTFSPSEAWLFFGGAVLDSVPDWNYQATSPIYLTTLCTVVPNLNGDQYADIILEPSNSLDSYVFFGNPIINTLPDQIINPSVGLFINTGDLDYDGYNDVLSRNETASWIRPLYGNPSGLIAGTIINTEYELETIGCCGDVDADIFDDISYASYYPNYYGQTFIYSDSTLTQITIEPSNAFLTFELFQNYPNPFNSSTIISFELKTKSKIELNVYNILGKKVTELSNSEYEAGIHTIKWNMEGISSGIYFIELKCGKQKEIKKLLLIR